MPRGTGKGGSGRGMGRSAVGGGGRMGGPAASGPAGECVCPACGYRDTHLRGVPCSSLKCPRCEATMTRGQAEV